MRDSLTQNMFLLSLVQQFQSLGQILRLLRGSLQREEMEVGDGDARHVHDALLREGDLVEGGGGQQLLARAAEDALHDGQGEEVHCVRGRYV